MPRSYRAPAYRAPVFVLLCFFATFVFAQSGGRFNDNLQSLTVPERVRVIERAYADQADNRLIPDDQLEFYLDQVDSGWDLNRIRNDISVTLRGEAWRAPADGNWKPRNVTCSSIGKRYTECRTGFRNPPKLTFSFSNSPCIEGRSWGHQPGLIWVDAGCRAQFTESQRGAYGDGGGIRPGTGIVCESREGKRRRCSTDFGRPPTLIEQFSSAPCIEGDTWGAEPGEIWVRQGCRGRFVESNQSQRPRAEPVPPARAPPRVAPRALQRVTCASENGRRRVCEWNRQDGRPRLETQLSDEVCVEGRNWGYDREQLWVNNGCRAEFSSR